MVILGIGGLVNDPACAIAVDGELVAAVEQKKLARRHAPGELPEEAIASCLSMASRSADQVDCVAIVQPIGPQAAQHLELRQRFPSSRIVVVEHHAAHAAAAFYPSGFDRATVLTLDRGGDFRCGARWQAAGCSLQLEKELYYPDSLGDLYGRVTALLGFVPNADEHKVQWLSAGGNPRLAGVFENILPLAGGWPRSARAFFDGERAGHGGFSALLYEQLGIAPGAPAPAQIAPDLAASIQRAVEKLVTAIAGTGENLCLGGGLFLNALLVAAVERSGSYRRVFVQPAAGNAGNALGAVFHAWHHVLGGREHIRDGGLFLGPSFGAEDIKKVLENCKLRFRYLMTMDEVIDLAVAELYQDRIVAWMHGRMEFGPRALGNRSILASPLNPYSTENLNVYIKHREPFRKFAASVPAELAAEYFDVGPNARFLATVGRVRPAWRERFATAVLGEDLIRVHTVTKEDNPLYWGLLHRAAEKSGLPVLYNTSFNLFGDPLVCTPRDAVRSFYSSGIDALFVGNFFLEK